MDSYCSVDSLINHIAPVLSIVKKSVLSGLPTEFVMQNRIYVFKLEIMSWKVMDSYYLTLKNPNISV